MSKHVAVYGPTGIGKTYTLYYGLSRLGKEVILIRSLEELTELDDDITDIIFDDISFELLKPELLIHLCDRDFDGGVRILRKYIKVSKKINKWFTHNSRHAWEPILATYEQQQAIERRLEIHHVESRGDLTRLVCGR